MQTPSSSPLENAPVQAFAPLPLRALGVLEIVDTAIKLLRRYFAVLAAWSAIVVLGSNSFTLLTVGMSSASGNAGSIEAASAVIGASFMAMLLAFFLWPFITGAVTCCIAAAVRGQTVTFAQCWNFTKPRYGKILGTYFLSILVGMAVIFALLFAVGIVVFLGAMAMQAGGDFGSIFMIFGIVLLYVSLAIIGLAVASWMMLAPIVACLENDPLNSPLRRAWDLLRGNWRRAMNLALLFGLIQLVIMVILLTFSVSAAAGGTNSGGVTGFLTTWGEATSGLLYTLLNTLVSIITTPLMLLLVAVLYLDLRTRKEALDLEWTAHVTSDTSAATSRETVTTPSPVFTPQPATPFNSVGVPAPPPDAPPIPEEMRAAWTGSAPITTNAPTPAANTQVLPNDATPNDVSTQAFSDSTNAIQNVTAPSNFDAPINVWAGSSPDVTPDVATADVGTSNNVAASNSTTPDAIPPAPPAFNLQAPPPVAQPSFTQLLPESDNTSTQSAANRTCTQCGTVAQEGQSFCMQCGARLPTANAS